MSQIPTYEVLCVPSGIDEFFKQVEAVYMFDEPAGRQPERREAKRISVTMPVHIKLLDDNLDPIDGACEGITRDLSQLGVGFVTLDPIGRQFVQLQLSPTKGQPLTIVGSIVYENQIGFYYQYGCKFITPDNEHFIV